jgi:uncharacterized protein (DUF2252 family)
MDGRTLRLTVPRSAHAVWDPAPDRDPLATLRAMFAKLIPDLVPVRVDRMSASPFTFLRGSAALMAADLAALPQTGVLTQISGDAHIANFGGYATPERRLVFDINDFDETVRGPWEWDVKRLATSILLAGRERGLRERSCVVAVRAAMESYRDRIAEYAARPSIDVWYASIDLSGAVRAALDDRARRTWMRAERDAKRKTAFALLPKITELVDGKRRFVEEPPLLERVEDVDLGRRVLAAYRATLRHEARVLLERFSVVDLARNVVGVGSVGTWCALMLLLDGDGNPLLLQLKEARASVLEPFVGPQESASPGERVVAGQRMMQAASDALLGWADVDGRCVYVRQYRDMKAAPDIAALDDDELRDYGAHCAWALARAHARAGDPRLIAGYIGRSSAFVTAVTAFAAAYAEQTTRDHAQFVAATKDDPALSKPS